VMPGALAEHVTRLMVNSNSCTASFTQMAGIAALQGDQTPVIEMVAEFKRRRDVLVAGLNRLPGVTCRSPRGAFYVFPNIKALKRPSTEVAEALLQEAGVAVLGGSAFGGTGRCLRSRQRRGQSAGARADGAGAGAAGRRVAGSLGAHRAGDRRGPAPGRGRGSSACREDQSKSSKPRARRGCPSSSATRNRPRASWRPSPASLRGLPARHCPRSAPASRRAPSACPRAARSLAAVYISDRHRRACSPTPRISTWTTRRIWGRS
jgi:hypothetical protein